MPAIEMTFSILAKANEAEAHIARGEICKAMVIQCQLAESSAFGAKFGAGIIERALMAKQTKRTRRVECHQ